MKRYSLWLKLALLFCVAMTIVSTPRTSLAYITARSNTLRNSFRVTYLPPQDISVPITIQKTMINLSEDGIGPGGFEFYLIDSDTGAAVAAMSSEDGLAAMQLSFTAEDTGKTYHYHLYELNDARENVIYDEKVYDITITLTLNEMHEMSAELTLDGEPVTEIVAEFENQYYVSAPLPDTGDPNHPLMWLIMLTISSAGLVMTFTKKSIFRRL